MHLETSLFYGLREVILVFHADELVSHTYTSALILVSCALPTLDQVSDGDVLSDNNPSFRSRVVKAGKHASTAIHTNSVSKLRLPPLKKPQ